MKHLLDETFVPCRWSKETIREDEIAFTWEGGRLTLVAESVGEDEVMPHLCAGPLWRIRCEQRAGEAESGIPLDYVPTIDTAMETLLTYMRRINGIADSEEDISVGTMIELLRNELPSNGRDDWGRTAPGRPEPRSPNP